MLCKILFYSLFKYYIKSETRHAPPRHSKILFIVSSYRHASDLFNSVPVPVQQFLSRQQFTPSLHAKAT